MIVRALYALAVLRGLAEWATSDLAVRDHLAFVDSYRDPFGHKARARHG